MIETALTPLAGYRQFITYTTRPSARPGKVDKIPTDPRTGQPCDAHNPASWVTYDEAAATGRPVGFVFTDADPFFFLDIDNCLQADGTWTPLALELCRMLAGAAVEVSHSGRGLHVFGTGQLPPHGCRNSELGLELYHSLRFVALGRPGAVGNAATDCTAGLAALVAGYFPPGAGSSSTPADWREGPVPEWRGPADDAELIRRMLAAKHSAAASFGNRATPAQLWDADADALARCYPDGTGGRAYDASAADAALAAHLAFWTGKDCERMRRLMRASALRREKYERDDYLPRTILGACASVTAVLIDQEPAAPQIAASATSAPVAATPTDRQGATFLSPEQQKTYFAGCVYICDAHKMLVPGGVMLKEAQFNALYGGVTFALDNVNQAISKKPFEAFTLSRAVAFPKADTVCFRPELAPGQVFVESGRRLANVWWPVETEAREGDVGPFLGHLARLLPVESDRAVVLAYMAALVQYPGSKFQWAPLIQGVEGNGKTLLASCIVAALGDRYCHLPNASDLGGNGGKFTGWLDRKLFIGVEEVNVGDRHELLEILKPLITNARVEIQRKGADQVTGDNRANWMLFSNYQGAIRKTRNDRRYAPFYTAQQKPGDLERDGMTGDYFPRLYAWLRAGGYAAVTHFLRSYKIPAELNPAGACHRAPVTSCTEEAIRLGLGTIEQEVLEAIEAGHAGFMGGWVSSVKLDALLASMHVKIARNKRREILASLGYVPHPGLPHGRATVFIMSEAGRPTLYIKEGHLSAALTDPAAIVRAYEVAQGFAPSVTRTAQRGVQGSDA